MKFYIYTLGCKVNTYESGVMRESLLAANYIETDNKQVADIYIINTCTVTNTSDNKSFKMIRQAMRENPDAIIIVTGCMSQIRYQELANLKGVAIILGNSGKSKIVSYLERYLKDHQQIVAVEDLNKCDFEPMQLSNFKQTRAFVKIQDGCENFCSYCIIPYSRGKVRSKEPRIVIDEIKGLVKQGHREVVLTGIHTGHYGSEFNNFNFADLLKEILRIDGLERLRISSIEMNEITDHVIELFKNNKILVDHLHIPLQSGSNSILKAMNRKYMKEDFILKIEKIRMIRPDISLTTDVIVGFPGETEELFRETLETIKKINFTKIHVFPYSRRSGTVADTLPDQIDDATKKIRVQELLALSKELEIKYMESFIGKTMTFIPEVSKKGYLIGHTGNYLLLKAFGSDDLLNCDVEVVLTKVDYPYIISKINVK